MEKKHWTSLLHPVTCEKVATAWHKPVNKQTNKQNFFFSHLLKKVYWLTSYLNAFNTPHQSIEWCTFLSRRTRVWRWATMSWSPAGGGPDPGEENFPVCWRWLVPEQGATFAQWPAAGSCESMWLYKMDTYGKKTTFIQRWIYKGGGGVVPSSFWNCNVKKETGYNLLLFQPTTFCTIISEWRGKPTHPSFSHSPFLFCKKPLAVGKVGREKDSSKKNSINWILCFE